MFSLGCQTYCNKIDVFCSLQQAGVPSEVLGSLQAQQWSAQAAPRAAQQPVNPAAPVDPNAQNNPPVQPPSEY